MTKPEARRQTFANSSRIWDMEMLEQKLQNSELLPFFLGNESRVLGRISNFRNSEDFDRSQNEENDISNCNRKHNAEQNLNNPHYNSMY